MKQKQRAKIRIIMHAFADDNDVNAQNLNSKEIAYRLNPDLFDITLFYKNKPDSRFINRGNVHLIKIDDRQIVKSLVILKNLLSREYDIFFYVRTFYLDYFYFKLKKVFFDKKITIHTIENILPYPAGKRYNRIAKANALNSDYIFSVSKYVAKTAEREYEIKTPIMYVGVNTRFFTPAKGRIINSNSKVKVLYVGSFQERKRPYLVLYAAKYFPNVEFHLIGDGPLKERLFSMKEKENLSNIYVHNGMPQKEIIPYYQNSDIFLFPSIHEGFPKVTIEAASCGLPGIVFGDYKPETVLNGKTGFIVKDFQEMLCKLEILINNSDLRHRMGKEAREYAKKFDWDVIVRRWEQIFVDALRERRNG